MNESRSRLADNAFKKCFFNSSCGSHVSVSVLTLAEVYAKVKLWLKTHPKTRHIHWLGLSAAWRDSLPQFTRPKNPDRGRCGGST